MVLLASQHAVEKLCCQRQSRRESLVQSSASPFQKLSESNAVALHLLTRSPDAGSGLKRSKR
jgi:hypothetical protein